MDTDRALDKISTAISADRRSTPDAMLDLDRSTTLSDFASRLLGRVHALPLCGEELGEHRSPHPIASPPKSSPCMEQRRKG